MIDMNVIIANNISGIMKKQNRKQVELAYYLDTNKQTVNKMLNGTRMINAVELKKIADFLNVEMEHLTKINDTINDTDVIRAFMGKVNSEEAIKGLEIADKISDMILFHRRVKENGIEMMEAWDDNE